MCHQQCVALKAGELRFDVIDSKQWRSFEGRQMTNMEAWQMCESIPRTSAMRRLVA